MTDGKTTLQELIEALQIFAKYPHEKYSTGAGHDVFYVNVDPKIVSDEDKIKLEELGFFTGEQADDEDWFYTYHHA